MGQAPEPVSAAELSVEVLTESLSHPWGLAMLPDNRILITEKPGQMRIFDLAGKRLGEPLSGVPEVVNQGQGGLLDVALHPHFESNQWVYISYSAGSDGQIGTEVGRARLTDQGLQDFEQLFVPTPKGSAGQHFGSRLVFDRDGYLFITLGDRGQQDEAQNLGSHIGTVVRLHDDGRVPEDNPFVNQQGALPEIYSYGHRNVQGADLNPWTGELWVHEHGPQGGDEVNLVRPGANYGWPVITYGANYGSGTAIGEGTEKQGMEQPLFQWTPSIAPSGMRFYDHSAIPQFQGKLLVGALAYQLLSTLEVDGSLVGNEQRLFERQFGRIRALEIGAGGEVFVLTDQAAGKLIRISANQAE